jgi:glycosyltransferase involved in cell wall biosynthesis
VVSIIIPAYNAAKTILETINSVFNQTYLNYEIIVVNDGSTDETLAVLAPHQNRIKLITTKNMGVSHARTVGLEASNGDFIQYLDADDLLAENKLEIQVNALNKTGAAIAYGDWKKFTLTGQEIVITESVHRKLGDAPSIEIFSDFWCPPACLLYTKNICKKLTWNENLPVIQDARYLLDASLAGG